MQHRIHRSCELERRGAGPSVRDRTVEFYHYHFTLVFAVSSSRGESDAERRIQDSGIRRSAVGEVISTLEFTSNQGERNDNHRHGAGIRSKEAEANRCELERESVAAHFAEAD